jgi:hypothetical protein
MFPRGAVPPGDRVALLERSLQFLRKAPEVSQSTAFGLRESMEKTLSVYQSALAEKAS